MTDQSLARAKEIKERIAFLEEKEKHLKSWDHLPEKTEVHIQVCNNSSSIANVSLRGIESIDVKFIISLSLFNIQNEIEVLNKEYSRL